MTHVAAVSNTLRTPRRRSPRPAAWQRAGAASGVAGALALVGAACLLSSTPSVDSTPAAIRDYLDGNYALTMASACSTLAAALLLVPFLSSLRMFTARRTDVSEWRGTVTLITGTIGITMLALAGGLLATAALLANRSPADESVFATFVAAKLLVTLALLPVAGLVLSNARTIAATQRRPDRWLVRFDIEIAVIAVLASIASFLNREWLAPGAQLVATAWFLIALWVVALARTITTRDPNFTKARP